MHDRDYFHSTGTISRLFQLSTHIAKVFKMETDSNDSSSQQQQQQSTNTMVSYITQQLKDGKPRRVWEIPEDLHPLPPFIAKEHWTKLGDSLKLKEQLTVVVAPGSTTLSFRCDGTGFSKFTKVLRAKGVMPQGFSQDLANMMEACCRGLMEKLNGYAAYTQSDELTVLVAPASVKRGMQESHVYGGRIQKLCSLAAATVTARFQYELMLLCKKNNVDVTEVLVEDKLPTFDCRIGIFDSKEEALALILWRAYDCGVNSVSDAVFHSGIRERKRTMKLNTAEKLAWLHEHHLLPLPKNQREGTFFVKRKRVFDGTNKKTGETVKYVRGKIEVVEGNVLILYSKGNLFPPDDNTIDEEE
jgi:tRNA(His) 5'-end guanylyltransferase